ncbi:MAG: amidohydrolase [Sphingomonadaceae bacterium]|nr:amidohydrolase [Sphingomonadaceae bacterium]
MKHLALLALFAATPALAAPAADIVTKRIDADAQRNAKDADAIWSFAEVGYKETRSSALLQARMKDAGFRVEPGVAGIPTAFTATYGSSGPVIAILGEFDALPGLSQEAVPEHKSAAGRDAGHGCGHNLFGVASASAAIAVADWLKASGRPGTVRFYGTPAEEGGAGKVYMVRAGLFKDVDVALHWHPGDSNSADIATSNANKSAKFRFHGVSAHAAGAPEKGRSALDGVEVMDVMTNFMREHMPQDARMHYVITAGGRAPNVVPDFAEVFYYVRHADPRVVEQLFDRVVKAAQGAAMGTGTTVDYEVIHGALSLLPNRTLQTLMHQKLTEVGGIRYSPADLAFAQKIYPTLVQPRGRIGDQEKIDPMSEDHGAGSTDVGDVSWTVPTAGIRVATFVPGTSNHSWQAVAAGGTDIGHKGVQVAAKTIALTAVELFEKPQLIAEAKTEWLERRGKDFVYRPLLGDRAPALNYRDAPTAE